MSKNSNHQKGRQATKLAHLFSSRSWTIFTFLLLVVAAGYAMQIAWQNYNSHVRSHPRFTPLFQVTSQPAWIQTDILQEVKRDGSLDEISLLDEQATRRIAEAFELHPWVRHVDHVSKHADGTVKVKLVFRKPVGMVKVKGGHFPVDEEGHLLPVDVVVDAVRSFARIECGKTWPAGVTGEPWGDSRVVRAAKIAAAFGAAWQELKLSAIVFNETASVVKHDFTGIYVLRTLQHHQIIWGNAPGDEARVEASTDAKIKRLVDYARTHGPLENLDPNIKIDLRNPETIKISRRLVDIPAQESTK